MRILLLSQWFEPEPTFKGMAFARALRERGHEVRVLTGFPNYPGGKLYPGYRVRPWQREQIDGIPLLRVPLYPSHGHSAAGRIANYASFALSAALASVFVQRPDVVYAYHPPATIGLPAECMRLLRGVPFVYDIQDLWPDSVSASNMMNHQGALRILNRWCGFLYRRAARIVVLSPGFKATLAARGVPQEKIEVVYNWCDEQALGAMAGAPVALGTEEEFHIVFAGTLGVAQALDAVLEAARICAVTVPRARFVFIGAGVEAERIERAAAAMALPNVRFLPRQPMNTIGRYLAAADALLVHLKDDPLYRITIPSKTQAYLAAGKPILMGVKGDAAALILRSGAGVVCEPNHPASIARAVEQLAAAGAHRLAEMGEAGRAFYARELSLAAGVDRFERIFADAAAEGGRMPGRTASRRCE